MGTRLYPLPGGDGDEQWRILTKISGGAKIIYLKFIYLTFLSLVHFKLIHNLI